MRLSACLESKRTVVGVIVLSCCCIFSHFFLSFLLSCYSLAQYKDVCMCVHTYKCMCEHVFICVVCICLCTWVVTYHWHFLQNSNTHEEIMTVVCLHRLTGWELKDELEGWSNRPIAKSNSQPHTVQLGNSCDSSYRETWTSCLLRC